MTFTPAQVLKLWQHQFGPWREPFDTNTDLPSRVHRYTCGKRANHPVMAGDKAVLVPTVNGWICPFCDYKQDWAHGVNDGTNAVV